MVVLDPDQLERGKRRCRNSVSPQLLDIDRDFSMVPLREIAFENIEWDAGACERGEHRLLDAIDGSSGRVVSRIESIP